MCDPDDLDHDAFIVEQSRALADRLQREAPANDAAKIARAWALLFGTAPDALDTARSLAFLHQQLTDLMKQSPDRDKAAAEALAAWCQVMLSTNRFLYVE